MRRVLIVGASLAAVHAIEGLRDNGYEGEVTLVGAESELPYDRPPLSKDALSEGPALDKLLLKAPGWYSDAGVELCLGTPAVGLDVGERLVSLADGRQPAYDGLVIATGSVPRSPALPGATERVHVLRSIADAARLHGRLRPGSHLVVIGGGFIGLEVAATARELGLDVSVVELAPSPLSRVLGDQAGRWFQEYHESQGVTVYCGALIDRLEPDGAGTKVLLRDGSVLAADVVVAGVGVAPATTWLDGSGIRLADGVVCDRSLRASAPRVVAAGDVARWYNPLFDEQMRVEQWSNAVEQGRQAAVTLLGGTDACTSVPYFWSDQFDAKTRFVGRANAAEQVVVTRVGDRSMVALFGRDSLLRGALCVNAPRRLALYRKAILDRVAWQDAAESLN